MPKFHSGRSASVTYNGQNYPFKKWELSVDRTRVDITNMTNTTGWRTFLNGFRNGTLRLDGPLDTDMPVIDSDATITVLVKIGGLNEISIPCVVLKNSYTQDVDDAARTSVEAAVTGTPTFTLGV